MEGADFIKGGSGWWADFKRGPLRGVAISVSKSFQLTKTALSYAGMEYHINLMDMIGLIIPRRRVGITPWDSTPIYPFLWLS